MLIFAEDLRQYPRVLWSWHDGLMPSITEHKTTSCARCRRVFSWLESHSPGTPRSRFCGPILPASTRLFCGHRSGWNVTAGRETQADVYYICTGMHVYIDTHEYLFAFAVQTWIRLFWKHVCSNESAVELYFFTWATCPMNLAFRTFLKHSLPNGWRQSHCCRIHGALAASVQSRWFRRELILSWSFCLPVCAAWRWFWKSFLTCCDSTMLIEFDCWGHMSAPSVMDGSSTNFIIGSGQEIRFGYTIPFTFAAWQWLRTLDPGLHHGNFRLCAQCADLGSIDLFQVAPSFFKIFTGRQSVEKQCKSWILAVEHSLIFFVLSSFCDFCLNKTKNLRIWASNESERFEAADELMRSRSSGAQGYATCAIRSCRNFTAAFATRVTNSTTALGDLKAFVFSSFWLVLDGSAQAMQRLC